MNFRTPVLLVLVHAFLSFDARASGSVEIAHTVSGTLGASATPAAVSAMLTSARWQYNNPDKERSTWEAMWLQFDPAGNVNISTSYAYGPRSSKATWRVVSANNNVSVDIGGVAYALAPCKFVPHATCLVGPLPPLS